MNQITDREFSEAIAATKKDAKLVAAAKNDRMYSAETMYREFEKLTLERRREIIVQICNEFFTAAQWKISFHLNNFPATALPDAILAAGKALFFAREEDSIRETVRALKIYQESPFFKQIATLLGHMAETTGAHLGRAAAILTEPPVFGVISSLDPSNANSEKIVDAVCRVASYTRDLPSTEEAARFLHARRFSSGLPDLARIVEEAVFMARDRRSVRQMLEGLRAGSIDVVLLRVAGDKAAVGAIRDLAWRSRNWRTIRNTLSSM